MLFIKHFVNFFLHSWVALCETCILPFNFKIATGSNQEQQKFDEAWHWLDPLRGSYLDLVSSLTWNRRILLQHYKTWPFSLPFKSCTNLIQLPCHPTHFSYELTVPQNFVHSVQELSFFEITLSLYPYSVRILKTFDRNT